MGPATNPSPSGDSVGSERAEGLPLAPSLLFYAALAGIAALWRVSVDGVGPWRPADEATAWSWAAGGLLGAAVGLGLVAGSRWWTARSPSGATLAETLAELVRGLSLPAIGLLALASGVAEEMLFRGALQPRVGWTAATLLFAAAHFLPRRGLRSWALFAALAGGVFGALFEWTGSLVAPATAHVLVNGLNLHWLARRG